MSELGQIAGQETGQTEQAQTETAQPENNASEQQTALDVVNSALGYVDGGETPVETETEKQDGEQPGETEESPTEQANISLEDLYVEPEGLAQKSSERFKALVEDSKVHRAQCAQLDEQMRAMNEDLQFMRETFFTDEQSANDFMQFAGYRESLKRGDFDSAMGMLQQQAQQLQLLAGRKLETDPLSAYPDLRQQVDDMALDEAHALELARYRALQTQQQQHTQQQAQRQAKQENEEQQAQQVIANVIGQIDQMEAQWLAQDLNYPAKREKLRELIPEMQRDFPPPLWPRQIAMLYQTLSGLTAAPQTSAPRVLKNAPLRPTGGNGGQPEPATMLEAVNQALNYKD